jgi:cyclophilin family peptidyl-prolyl cis-trans isomerase
MKKFKKLLINVIACIMTATCVFSLTACVEDIRKLEIKIETYNYEANGAVETHTMNIDLYRHLAPKTVDAIVNYVNEEGYYNDAIFYKMKNYGSQIMFGDLVYRSGIKANEVKPTLPGEFTYGGTVGSNLTNKKGSIGLWRSWYEADGGYSDNRNATDSGRATMFMPTSTLSSYNDYFCVFGQFDAEATENAKTLETLEAIFASSSNYEEYVIYYTGEYDATKADSNYGLTFNCVSVEDYKEVDTDTVFKAEGAQLVCYNATNVYIPMANGVIGARIISANII